MTHAQQGYAPGMDENPYKAMKRSRWLRFTIRDLLWAMVVAAVACGWWAEHRELAQIKDTFRSMRSGGFDIDGWMTDWELREAERIRAGKRPASKRPSQKLPYF